MQRLHPFVIFRPTGHVDIQGSHVPKLVAAVAQGLTSSPVCIDEALFLVKDVNHILGKIEHRVESLLAPPQGHLRLLPRHDFPDEPCGGENAFLGELNHKGGAGLVGLRLSAKLLHGNAVGFGKFAQPFRIAGRISVSDADASHHLFTRTDRNGKEPDSSTAGHIHRPACFDGTAGCLTPTGFVAVPFADFHGLPVIRCFTKPPRCLIQKPAPIGRDDPQGIVAIFLTDGAGGVEEDHQVFDKIGEEGSSQSIMNQAGGVQKGQIAVRGHRPIRSCGLAAVCFRRPLQHPLDRLTGILQVLRFLYRRFTGHWTLLILCLRLEAPKRTSLTASGGVSRQSLSLNC
ncbi:MAG: hypothetical protein A4E72_01786 [Syntrophus sp. PtaU1.Bin208]|nr:MAG: hypothetical protein A4E72_01786 [Syntrophus sp. PtaU1.Bin208]